MGTRRALRNPSAAALVALTAVAAAAAPFVARPALGQEAPSPAVPTTGDRPAEARILSGMAPRADRGRLGLFLRLDCGIEPGPDGECSTPPVVSSVVESAPAARAGIQPGDTLLSLDGVSLRSERGRRVLDELRAGVSVRLEVGRTGGRRQIDVTPAARPMAGLFDVNIEGRAWLPDVRETTEVRVFRFRDDDGGMAAFYFSPTPDAPPTPDGFVVFGEDEAGELRLETGRPRVALRTPDGRRIELTELARRATGDERLNVEIELMERDGREVRHRVVLENAELAQRLESVHENVLEEARVRLDSLRRRQVVLARRGELPPAAAAGFAYRVRSDGRSGAEVRAHAPSPRRHDFRFSTIAPEHRLAGAEFRPLTPELAEYFPVDAGLLVLRVIPATPAHDLGLRGGDVVVEVGGRKMPDINVFRRLVAESLSAPEAISVKWNRKGTEMTGRLPVD